MNVNRYVEWQYGDLEEDNTVLVPDGAVPRPGDLVDIDGCWFKVERIVWRIFNRPEAPGGGATDVYACVELNPTNENGDRHESD